VANVILGVGGVLGLGEHYVAVAFDKLKWVDQPVARCHRWFVFHALPAGAAPGAMAAL